MNGQLFDEKSFRQFAELARIAIKACDDNTPANQAERDICAQLQSIRDIVERWDRDRKPGEPTDPRTDAALYLNTINIADQMQMRVKDIQQDINRLKTEAQLSRNRPGSRCARRCFQDSWGILNA